MQQDNNNQKQINILGILFIILIAISLIMSFAVSLLAQRDIYMPVELTLVISELALLVPGIIYILINNMNLRKDLGFVRIKVGTIFMSILLSFLITPVVSFINVLSQFFVTNTLVSASDSLLSGNNLIILFLSAIYGPFCEEVVFRGVFNNQLKRYSTPLKAALLSGLLFGLMHLNVNQACYAFVLGIIFAIINRASGSIYTSMIIHTVINGTNMITLMLTSKVYEEMGMDLATETASFASSDQMYITAGVYLVLAIIFGLISIPCIVFIAKHEGHYEELTGMFAKSDNSSSVKLLLNAPMIIAIVLCLSIIFGLEPLLATLGIG